MFDGGELIATHRCPAVREVMALKKRQGSLSSSSIVMASIAGERKALYVLPLNAAENALGRVPDTNRSIGSPRQTLNLGRRRHDRSLLPCLRLLRAPLLYMYYDRLTTDLFEGGDISCELHELCVNPRALHRTTSLHSHLSHGQMRSA